MREDPSISFLPNFPSDEENETFDRFPRRVLLRCDVCPPFFHCASLPVFWSQARLTNPFHAEAPDPLGVSAVHKHVVCYLSSLSTQWAYRAVRPASAC